MQRHVLSVLVENEPGVLSRVAGLFSGRGFNIASLNVAPTLEEGDSIYIPEKSAHRIYNLGDNRVVTYWVFQKTK